MELVQLKHFVKLAELLSFTRAAKASFVTQSTLSASIKRLEDELGVRLFDRIGKRVFLTDHGRLFLTYAADALARISEGVQELEVARKEFRGELRVGVTYSLGGFLQSRLPRFTGRYPKVRLSISMFNTVEEIINSLSGNALDVAITYRPKDLPPFVEVAALETYPLSAVVSEHHPLAVRTQVSLADLLEYPLATFVKGTHTRYMVDLLLSKNEIKAEPHIEVNDTGFIIALVETGNWVSLLAPVSLHAHARVKAIPVKGRTESLSACLMWLKGKSRPTLRQMLIDELLAGPQFLPCE